MEFFPPPHFLNECWRLTLNRMIKKLNRSKFFFQNYFKLAMTANLDVSGSTFIGDQFLQPFNVFSRNLNFFDSFNTHYTFLSEILELIVGELNSLLLFSSLEK